METLIAGAIKFMDEDFQKYEELFADIGKRQTPHTLFITCTDSRVVPNLITNTKPGELFTVRNIANIVAPYRMSEDFLAATSAIEYALNILGVQNVIICGHSDCGGCSALYEDETKYKDTPHVKQWLKLLEPIKKEVLLVSGNKKARRNWLTERLNIVKSIKNIFTFPNVKQRYDHGEINVYGWHYIIETGEIFNYNIEKNKFELLDIKLEYERIYKGLFKDF